MTAILQDTEAVREINSLNDELMNLAQQTIQKAIRIGKLLMQEKAKLPHGDWMHWLDSNIRFSYHTANNYIRLYERRNDPKLETVSNLKDAYKCLSENDLPTVPDRIDPKSVKRKPRKQRAGSIRVRERCPTCGRVMTKEIIAKIKKGKRKPENEAFV